MDESLRSREGKGHWEIFSDGSYAPDKGQAYSCVFWGPEGKLRGRWMGLEKKHGGSPVEAELKGVLLALQMKNHAIPRGRRNDPWVFYLDCQSAVKVLNGKARFENTEIQALAEQIIQASRGANFRWVPRKENRDAHQCAKRAFKMTRPRIRGVPKKALTAKELEARNMPRPGNA